MAEFPLAAARVYLVLVALNDVMWRGTQPELDAVLRLLGENGGVIETIMPPLVKVVFDLPIGAAVEAKARLSRGELVAAIQNALGHRMRIVHGSVDCLHGSFGTDYRFSYGTQIPGFDTMIRAVLTLEPGTAQQVQQPIR